LVYCLEDTDAALDALLAEVTSQFTPDEDLSGSGRWS
jgi:hypothetical protein